MHDSQFQLSVPQESCSHSPNTTHAHELSANSYPPACPAFFSPPAASSHIGIVPAWTAHCVLDRRGTRCLAAVLVCSPDGPKRDHLRQSGRQAPNQYHPSLSNSIKACQIFEYPVQFCGPAWRNQSYASPWITTDRFLLDPSLPPFGTAKP